MSQHPPALPHGTFTEVFPDIHVVTGAMIMDWDGQRFEFSRNMTVLAHDGELTLVNTVRLDDDGLRALDDLGRVAHVVKLGSFHGRDDAFYLDRYDVQLWALEGMAHPDQRAPDHLLQPGGDFPVPDCTVLCFETSAKPEGLILVEREGGVLIACDSLQNWAKTDEYFSAESAAMMEQIGFICPANIGPGWKGQCNPQASDFARIADLDFRHLLSAHGTPLRDTAREDLSATFARHYDL